MAETGRSGERELDTMQMATDRANHPSNYPQADARAGSGGDDPMPVFTIKAKDNLAPSIIEAYAGGCVIHGLDDQAVEVIKAHAEVLAWRERNPDLCKWPDHKHEPAVSDR